MKPGKDKPVVVIEAAPQAAPEKRGIIGRIFGVGQNIINLGRPPDIQAPEDLKTDNTSTAIIVVVVLLALLGGVYFITKKK